MKKIFLAILTAVFLVPSVAWGDLLLTENFDYATGNLYQCGKAASPSTPKEMGWIKGTNTADPIQVVAGALTYSGYQNTATGNAVALKGTPLGEDMQIAFSNDPVLSGVLYVSMLVKVTDATSADTYFASLTTKKSAGWTDAYVSTEVCRPFVMEGSDANHFKFGICRGATTPYVQSSEYSVGTTYLVVIKYEFKSGTTNDPITMWINPASAAEPATGGLVDDRTTGTEASATLGLMGIELRQGTTASKIMASMTIDALRVATTWADLFDGEDGEGGEGEEGDPDPTYNKYECATVAALIAQEISNAKDTCVLTGDALVTFVSGTTAYIEDATGAIALSNANGLAVGDIISVVQGTFNATNRTLALVEDATVKSHDNEVTPTIYTLSELNSSFATLTYRYVKLENIQFAAPGTFGSGSYKFTQNGENGYVKSETGYLRSEAIPTDNVHLIGFCGSNVGEFELKKASIEVPAPEAPTEISADLTEEDWAELNGKTVQITINRTLTAGMINTICLPYAMDNLYEVFGTSEVYALQSATLNYDNELILTFGTLTSISAGRPYFIIPTKDVTTWTTEEKVTLNTEAKTTHVGDVDFVGVLASTELEANNKNILFLGANNTLFYPNVTANIPGMRGYFRITNADFNGAPARIRLHDNTTTGMEETLTAERAQKLLQEGRVIIRIENHDYDINGKMIR